jgi:hypothetical protein
LSVRKLSSSTRHPERSEESEKLGSEKGRKAIEQPSDRAVKKKTVEKDGKVQKENLKKPDKKAGGKKKKSGKSKS